MTLRQWKLQTIATAISGVAVLSAGCDKGSPAEADAASIEAKLAKADAADGKTDRVVSKCAGCSLGMDGKAEYSLAAHGYTLHLCSDHCKSEFGKDVDKSITAMEVPE